MKKDRGSKVLPSERQLTPRIRLIISKIFRRSRHYSNFYLIGILRKLT